MDEGLVLLLVGAVLAASVLVALGSARTGVPVLVAFLALGMLLGSDGPGGIEFDDAELAREVGIVGLVLILFEGGLQTSWRRLRSVVVPAALLSTVGVVVTMLLTGVAAQALFDLTWLEAFLLGAVVASTDAAAVFATLRFTQIRRRLARTLEAESGGNDPMAIALTLGLIAWIESPDTSGFADLALLVVRQLGLGLVIGVVLASPRPGSSRGSRARSAPSPRWRPWPQRRSRSGRRTWSAAAASLRCTSSASPSAARRRATAGSSSASTKGSRSSPRSRCSSSSACLSSHASSPTSRARASPSRCCSFSSSGPPRSGCRRRSTTSTRGRSSSSAGRACGEPCRSCSRRSCSRPRSRPRTRSSTPSSSSSSSRRSCRGRRSSASRLGSDCCPRRRRPTRRHRGRRVQPARPPRLRRRPRPRDRGRCRPRGRSPEDCDHRGRRTRRRLDPAARKHDHRAGRPPVRPRAALDATRGRGRLLPLASSRLTGDTLAACRRSSTSSTATARSSRSRRSTGASGCTWGAFRRSGSRAR